jgi:ribonuclease BN (tRNA processing enzyme)
VEARLLGSGGWMPSENRDGFCLLVRQDSTALCVDAGTGLRRLVTEPSLVEGVERLHIVLTHWHLDHTCGLVSLPGLDLDGELWGPPPADELVHRLVGPPFLFATTDDLDAKVTAVHDLEPPSVRIGPFELDLRIQHRHPCTTLALKIDGVLAVCTDTGYDAQNVDFARGSRILLHEAFHAADSTDDWMHTAAGDAARLAAAAGVKRLVLVHTNPSLADDDELLRHAREAFPAVEVGRDGLVIV